jgi:hypothetical protein
MAASKACDPALRLMLLSLAFNYRTLADYVDQRSESGTEHKGDQDQDVKKEQLSRDPGNGPA